MLISKTIIVKWGASNKKHYEELGYKFTSIGDKFVVDVNDLPRGSDAKVEVECDYCGKIILKSYNTYNDSTHPIGGDACKACSIKKREKIMLEEKGVKSCFQLKEVRQAIKHTMIERYGVEYSMQNKEVQEKSKQTCLEKYGHEYAIQSEEVVARRKNTWDEKYGGHPMSTKEVKDKRVQTTFDTYGVEWITQSESFKQQSSKKCMEKYGVENFGKVKELHEKGIETMRKNGTLPVSKPEENMVNLLIDIYGEENCTPSKCVDWYTLDCELIINDIKIDVEFDGKHWHCESEEQSSKDKIRDGYMKHNNYKVLRFRGSHSAPSREQIVDAISKLITEDIEVMYIDI